jgi:leader peptidase (prepilin peptidase) / N-methyltransferase
MAAASLGLAFVSVLATVAVIDLDRRVIPNRILFAGAVAGVAIIAPSDPGSLPERAIAALAASGFLLLGTVANRAGMGMGDVKLAALMGLYLGTAVAPALLVAFAAGAVAGIVLMIRNGTEARRRAIPFGPFLALGGVAGLLAGGDIVAWYVERLLT